MDQQSQDLPGIYQKKMIKVILYKFGKKAVMWGLKRLYNYVDKNDDSKISWIELDDFVKESRIQLTKIKKKLNN